MTSDITTSRRLAPEDLREGDYVAITAVIHEVYPLCVYFERGYAPPEPLRLTCIECANGEPLKVLAICLPFVLVRGREGRPYPLDVRRHRLARLDKRYARKALKPPKQREPSEPAPANG